MDYAVVTTDNNEVFIGKLESAIGHPMVVSLADCYEIYNAPSKYSPLLISQMLIDDDARIGLGSTIMRSDVFDGMMLTNVSKLARVRVDVLDGASRLPSYLNRVGSL